MSSSAVGVGRQIFEGPFEGAAELVGKPPLEQAVDLAMVEDPLRAILLGEPGIQDARHGGRRICCSGLMPQATQRDRNRQLGGHRSGE